MPLTAPLHTWPGEVIPTAIGTYVAWQVKYPETMLSRIDPATGRLVDTVRLAGNFVQAVEAGGSLWVLDQTTTGDLLERRDPANLSLIGSRRLGNGVAGPAGSLVPVGSYLWVAGGPQPLQLSLPQGSLVRSLSLPPGVHDYSLGGGQASTLIVDYQAGLGSVYFELVSADTGNVIAKSDAGLLFPVTSPRVSAIADGGFWISVATGMQGYIERMQTPSLRLQLSTKMEGSNGISASLADGVLWVTQGAGGPTRNYCGDPATGHPYATFAAAIGSSGFLTAVGGGHYFLSSSSNEKVVAEYSIPRICARP